MGEESGPSQLGGFITGQSNSQHGGECTGNRRQLGTVNGGKWEWGSRYSGLSLRGVLNNGHSDFILGVAGLVLEAAGPGTVRLKEVKCRWDSKDEEEHLQQWGYCLLIIIIIILAFVFGDRISCSRGWPRIRYVWAEDVPRSLILLLLPLSQVTGIHIYAIRPGSQNLYWGLHISWWLKGRKSYIRKLLRR